MGSATYQSRNLALGIAGFAYADLYQPQGLRRLYGAFLDQVTQRDVDLGARLRSYLEQGSTDRVAESRLLIAAARHLGPFLAELFGIQRELEALDQAYLADRDRYRFRTHIIKRTVAKRAADGTSVPDPHPIAERYLGYRHAIAGGPRADGDTEAELAGVLMAVYDRYDVYRKQKKKPDAIGPGVRDWTRQLHAKLRDILPIGDTLADIDAERGFLEGVLEDLQAHVLVLYREQEPWPRERRWSSFQLPRKLDPEHLVETEPGAWGGVHGPERDLRRRDGFALTDERFDHPRALGEIEYCLYCFDKGKDSCSKGFKNEAGGYRANQLDIDLTGCPLDQRISESHHAANDGDPLGALAIIMIDNPMCPGTGHRICNECMRGCIYQDQDPVNIPQIETRLLTDTLRLPYGVEIYGLLTRWNPLRRDRPYALPYRGVDVLVVGQGPAGYTLAQYLTQEGFGVVGIDGLKIEPLDPGLTGADCGLPRLVRDWSEITKPTDQRILQGFGGVSEYGITVRWDKNFLGLIYLTLARKPLYRVYGGTRFGGTLSFTDAWELGFDHIALATGAGKPTIIRLKNNLIGGIRKASDFLMTLQLTGAAKADSLASLQIRLPALVVGGGLTGIDTTTEIFAYYPLLVEKVLDRQEALAADGQWAEVDTYLSAHDREVLAEYLEHGRAVRAERLRARLAGEQPDFVRLVRSWGGVVMAYRKGLKDSPAYRLNYEEVVKALEEGIEVLDRHSPVEALEDGHGHLRGLVLEQQADTGGGKWQGTGVRTTIPARSLLIAAGTSPNTMIARENPGRLPVDEDTGYFTSHHAVKDGDGWRLERGPGFLSGYQQGQRFVSFYGDNHPQYAGNVVKAMASAKHGYRSVATLFADRPVAADAAGQARLDARWKKLVAACDDGLRAQVVRVDRLTPTIVEVVMRAPYAARNFQPGQFYRVQRYERLSPILEGTRLGTEGMALTGAAVDREKGELSVIVLEMGHSSRTCANFAPGEPVVCMGPTGEPTELPEHGTVCLVGGGLGNAVLFSIAEEARRKGNRVMYFAGYKDAGDIFKLDELVRNTDVLVLCVDRGQPPAPTRPQDRIFHGNIVQAMNAYGRGELGAQHVPLQQAERLIVIGSDRMMAAVKAARHGVLKDVLSPCHHAIGSINSPMQCMMKEICAQCLQKHVDPVTGKERYVFTCTNQDQPLDQVCFSHLGTRLKGNSLLEKINAAWMKRLVQLHADELQFA